MHDAYPRRRIRFGSLPAHTFADVTERVMARKGGRVYFIGFRGFILAWRRGWSR